MTTESSSVSIVTSAHWPGDARLNRHVSYLAKHGHLAQISSTVGSSRIRASLRALWLIAVSKSEVLLLPDPELFLIGSLIGRLRGKWVVIDIHEDYAAAAAARPWVPAGLRGVVALGVKVATWLGRRAASDVIVAAPQLAQGREHVIWNVPDPATMDPSSDPDPNRLCYVGDITEARGAFEMLELIDAAGSPHRLLLIGRIAPAIEARFLEMIAERGLADRVELAGRLDHATAWGLARDSLAGLNLLRPVPAYMEAVGTKIWEYLLIGVPPIVSNLPGQAEVVRKVSPDLVAADLEAQLAVLSRLRTDAEFRSHVVEAGRRLAEHQWVEVRPDLRLQEAVVPLPMTNTVASEPTDS